VSVESTPITIVVPETARIVDPILVEAPASSIEKISALLKLKTLRRVYQFHGKVTET